MVNPSSDSPSDSPRAQPDHTQGPVPDQQSLSRRSLRILVVDDLVDAAESLAIILRLHGHVVRTAHDGSAALATAAAFVPQVVLLDIGMPQLDGFRVAEQLREQRELQNACLIAITGHAQPADRQAADHAGFDHYLLKPVDADELLGLFAALHLP